MISNPSSNWAQGAPSVFNKTNFFTDNDPYGIADASAFLDVYYPMTPKAKEKFANHIELMRQGASINGMIELRHDRDNIPYVWAEMQLLRGVVPFKMVMLSPQMFEFMVRYQQGLVSVRFTLQELVAEAEALDKKPSPQLKGM